MARYRLADPEARVPMPDRGGRLFKPGEKGEAIDPESRFYATLIAEGGIVEVKDETAVAAGKAPSSGKSRKSKRKRT